jgi:hypothetical protein
MVVRIQMRLPPTVRATEARIRRLALRVSSCLIPASVAASACAFWRLGADLNWTGQFAISRGLFSHWQVWLAAAVLLQILASRLNRYGRGDGAAMP